MTKYMGHGRAHGWSTKLALAMVMGLGTWSTLGCSPVVRVRPFNNDKIAYWTAEGGVVISSRAGEGTTATTRICVAPPAQGSRQKDLTGALGGKVPKTEIELDASGTIDHETMVLYDQSDAGLFFQFALYRLCEAYLNGAIDNTQYIGVYSCLVKEAAGLIEVEHRYADAANERAKWDGILVRQESEQKKGKEGQPGEAPGGGMPAAPAPDGGATKADGGAPKTGGASQPPQSVEQDCWARVLDRADSAASGQTAGKSSTKASDEQ